MKEFNVTIGVKVIKVKAETEGEATSQAMDQLGNNVAWVQVTAIEPRATGFHFEAPVPPQEAA